MQRRARVIHAVQKRDRGRERTTYFTTSFLSNRGRKDRCVIINSRSFIVLPLTWETLVVAKKILVNLRRMIENMKETKRLGGRELSESLFDRKEPATRSVDQILSNMVRAKL